MPIALGAFNGSERLELTSTAQSLPDPLGNRHVAGSRHPLDLPVVGVIQDNLQPFNHTVGLIDSLL